MKQYFIFCLAFLLSIQVLAQDRTISGVVTDQEGNPLEGVLVKFEGKVVTQTDKDGRYEIELSATDDEATIVFSHPEKERATGTIGIYNQLDVKMSDIGEVSFELSLEELLNMNVVTASKKAEKQSDAPGIISVLTKDDLDRFGGTTLKDILERVPGLISSTTGYTNRTVITVRGDQVKQNSSHVLILLNGRPMREIQEGGCSSEIFEAFPVNVIERIEVIKGPGSVLYGSDAFSGVINIITKEAKNNNVSVAGLVGDGGAFGTSGEGAVSLGGLNIVVAGRYHEKATWKAPFETIPFMSTTDTTLILEIPDKSIGAFLDLRYKGFSLTTTYNEWNTFGAGIFTDHITNSRVFTNMGYQYNINEKWNTDVNVTLNHSGLVGTGLSERSSNNIVAEWTNFFTVTEKSNLILGGLYNNNSGEETTSTLDPNYTTIVSEGTISGFGLYAQYDYHLLDNMKLIAGLQANKVEGLKLSLAPRLGVIWYPVEKLSIKGLYSQAFRAPRINELYMNFPGLVLLLGNEDLDPEKVSTIDVGIGYQAEQVQLRIDFFHSSQSGIIRYFTDTASGASIFNNLDDIKFTGGEFEGKYYVNKNLYINASALYQTNENDNDENLVPIANLGLKAGISYMSNNGITLGLFNLYQGDLDDKFKNTRNEDYQGAYNLLHFHSNFNINKLFKLQFKPKLELFIDIDNMLDKKVYLWDLTGDLDAIPKIPGREVYFGLKVSFN